MNNPLSLNTACKWKCQNAECGQDNLVIVYFPNATTLRVALERPYPLTCVVCGTQAGMSETEALEASLFDWYGATKPS